MKATWFATRCLCVLLIIMMLGLLICQFVPFWTVEDDTASISQFIWKPSDHKTINRDFKANVDKNFSMNDVYTGPVLFLVLGAVSVIISMFFMGRLYAFLSSAVTGFSGIYLYLSHPIFRMGTNWYIHFGVAIAILTFSVIGLLSWYLTKVTSVKNYQGM